MISQKANNMTTEGQSPENVEIIIDTIEELDVITLTFDTSDKNLTIALSLGEAQFLSSWLNEAITKMTLKKLNIIPPTTRH